VLDCLTCPHHVEARVLQRQRGFGLHELRIQVGVTRPHAPQRLLGNVDRYNLSPIARKGCRKVTFAAAYVEHA
jgi:hypothetical protein